MNSSVSVDDLDRQIMALLRTNGRMPYKTIAQRVSLSETAVRHRVQRLLRNNVFVITTAMQPYALGLVGASVRVRAQGRRVTEVAEKIAEIPEVDWLVITAGTHPIEVEVMAAGPDALYADIERIESIDGVESTETSVHLRVLKYLLET